MDIDYYDYGALLKRAREQLPEEVFKDVRFEIPEPETFIEGSKTIIRNFKEIAKSIDRDANYFA